MKAYLDKLASLIPTARQIICEKATEPPGSGQYNHIPTQGTYLCRRCGWALFRASSQFSAGCGWPSFDEDLLQRVHSTLDPDGIRVEIICGRCEAHLGHVFTGEQFTAKSKRYCVNSLALDFVTDTEVLDTAEAIVAGGCFWGIEHTFKHMSGVVKAESGYTGGHQAYPTYHDVCAGETGHYEAVRVVYDVAKTNYKMILNHFFAHHNPYQADGQGPDRGLQYSSAIFYYDMEQYQQAIDSIGNLNKNGQVMTTLHPVTPFWPAEDYHQDYYHKHPNQVYKCN